MHRPSAEGGLSVTPVLDERPQHNPIHYGELAQLGERLVCNQEVTGSIPVFSTTKFADKAKAARVAR